MKIVLRSLDSIKPYAGNPRKIDGKAIDAVAKSIREFGFLQPVVVDDEGVIIVGHVRYQAANKLSLEKVPVVVASGLSPEKVRAFRIADNKTAELSSWDLDLLPIELGELESCNYDLGLLGFGPEELSKLINGGLREGLCDPNEIPEPPAKPITKSGDLWLLGNHRLLCGDSTNGEDVKKVMDGEFADMVFTDHPYNVAVCGGSHDSRDKKNFGKGPKIKNDSMSDSDFKQFLLRAFTCMYQVVKPGAAVYVAHADSEGINFRCAFVESGFLLKQCLIWVKQQFVFGRSDYHWQHEPILYGWRGGASHQFLGERNQGTTWNIDRPMRSDKEHPTQKPIELPAKAIANSSKEMDVLYEPFSGSGSTLIAAEQLGRRCFGLELDPVYCDVIVTRWEKFTGKKAVRASNDKRDDHSVEAKRSAARKHIDKGGRSKNRSGKNNRASASRSAKK